MTTTPTTVEPDPIMQGVYEALLNAAEALEGCDADDPRLIELATAAAALNGGDRGCDGCDRMLDEETFAYAGWSWAVAYDSNGDPDVAICPPCRADSQRPPL